MDSLCFTVNVNVVYIRNLGCTILAVYIFLFKGKSLFQRSFFFTLVCVLAYIIAANLLVS